MEHTLSKVKVYASSDYKRFRVINKRKIEKIIAEIEAGNDILDESPILVTEKKSHLEINDGQHRFSVAERLKRPVHYIIKKQEMSLYNIAKVNSNTERWKDADFINCYVKAGNDNYKKIKSFQGKYGFATGVTLVLLTNGSVKTDGGQEAEKLRKSFEEGTFEVKKMKEATQFAELCQNFSAFHGWNGRGFIIAISRILESGLCDFAVLKKKFDRDPSKLTNQPNWKMYVNNLEIIYNYDNSKRKPII